MPSVRWTDRQSARSPGSPNPQHDLPLGGEPGLQASPRSLPRFPYGLPCRQTQRAGDSARDLACGAESGPSIQRALEDDRTSFSMVGRRQQGLGREGEGALPARARDSLRSHRRPSEKGAVPGGSREVFFYSLQLLVAFLNKNKRNPGANSFLRPSKSIRGEIGPLLQDTSCDVLPGSVSSCRSSV